MYTIETKTAGPNVLLLTGVHGDEYEPILAALKLIDYLPEILKSGTVTIAPIVNESAYENGTRCGVDGLDLARTCPGSPDGTVTERAASQISEIIKKSDYLIGMLQVDWHMTFSLDEIYVAPITRDTQKATGNGTCLSFSFDLGHRLSTQSKNAFNSKECKYSGYLFGVWGKYCFEICNE